MEAAEFRPLYDLSGPTPRQRNRVVSHTWSQIAPRVGDTLRRGGLGPVFEMRALICDGPTLLAWVGGYREEGPSSAETSLFGTLIASLQRRLTIEHRLGDALLWRSGVAAALDQLGAPAFLVDEHGRIKHANALGAERFDRSRGVLARIRAAVAGERTEMRVTPLGGHGLTRGFLVIEPRDGGRAQQRAARARASWRLTLRETQVLELLARGEPMKLVADRLACAMRTVEAHATSIYRKAGVTSRAELLAKLWNE